MKYEVKIIDSVKHTIVSYYRKALSSPVHPWRLALFEKQVIDINEILNEVFLNLKTNPLQYPTLFGEVRAVVELYLPFKILYVIKDSEVILFDTIS